MINNWKLRIRCRGLFIIAFLICVLLGCSDPEFNCDDPFGCLEIAPGEPVKIGIMQSLTGGAAQIGAVQDKTMRLAFKLRENQLLDHPVEFILVDEKCTSEGGTTAAMKLVADPQVVAILGPTCSSAAISASKIVSDAGMVMISGASSSPVLTSIGAVKAEHSHDGFFRTISNAGNMGRAAAVFAFRELGIKKAGTINDADAFAKSNTEFFIETFESLGGEIVLDGVITRGEANMVPILSALNNAGAKFIFFPVFMPDGLSLVRDKRKAGLEDVVLMGMGALMNDTFIKQAGDEGKGLYLVLPAPPEKSDIHLKLIAAYKKEYQEEPSANLYGFAYDAANILYDTLLKTAIREKSGTLHFGRKALRDAMHKTAKYQGVTGEITSDPFGDMGAPRFNIIRLDNPEAGIEGWKSNLIYTYSPDRHS